MCSGVLSIGISSSESSGCVLFVSPCHGFARLCKIVCIDMMTFRTNLYMRGHGDVCQGFELSGRVLVLDLESVRSRWVLGLFLNIS